MFLNVRIVLLRFATLLLGQSHFGAIQGHLESIQLCGNGFKLLCLLLGNNFLRQELDQFLTS